MSARRARTKGLRDAVRMLRSGFHGRVLEPDDAAYEWTRGLWNGIIDRHPALIAQCRGTADVVAAVNFARANRLAVAVRGGGHNVAGLACADGGIVIDLSGMNAVHVDPAAKVVRAEGGALIGDLDRETQAHGLAVPMGVVSATGIAGLTLGGGMGWLRRKYGLSCDSLIAANVVTADGRLVCATVTENADLLWGLRGGGGNFGVVTSFAYRAYDLGPEVAFNVTFYPLSEAKKVFYAHRAFIEGEPGEVSTLFALGRLPHEELPEDLQGRPFAAILAMHAGESAEGWEQMRPLREICEPLVDFSGIMPYLEAQRFFDADYPSGLRYYWKSASLPDIGDEVLDILIRQARRAPSDRSTLDVWYHGGKMAEPAADATAYGRRDIPYLVNGEANWESPEDDEANIAWVRETLAELAPFSARHLYLNFPGFLEEGDALMQAAFGRNYPRLVDLKTKYDPENVFRMNHNIKPRE